MSLTEYKVILMGVTQVGKSSIIQKLPLGVNLGGKKEIQYMSDDGERYKLIVFDTPCIDESAANDASYYEGSNAVIFLGSYDIKESLTSFPQLRAHLQKFIQPDSYTTYFAMNKCDIKGTNPMVTAQDIQNAKDELHVTQAYDISVQEKIGIRNLFEMIAHDLHEKLGKK